MNIELTILPARLRSAQSAAKFLTGRAAERNTGEQGGAVRAILEGGND